jgi:hypothetical protein
MYPEQFMPSIFRNFSRGKILSASKGIDFNKIYNTVKTLKNSDTVIFSGNIIQECPHNYENCELDELSNVYFLRLFICITDLRKK